jgi:hypothetical protein
LLINGCSDTVDAADEGTLAAADHAHADFTVLHLIDSLDY